MKAFISEPCRHARKNTQICITSHGSQVMGHICWVTCHGSQVLGPMSCVTFPGSRTLGHTDLLLHVRFIKRGIAQLLRCLLHVATCYHWLALIQVARGVQLVAWLWTWNLWYILCSTQKSMLPRALTCIQCVTSHGSQVMGHMSWVTSPGSHVLGPMSCVTFPQSRALAHTHSVRTLFYCILQMCFFCCQLQWLKWFPIILPPHRQWNTAVHQWAPVIPRSTHRHMQIKLRSHRSRDTTEPPTAEEAFRALVTFHMQTLMIAKNNAATHANTPKFVTNAFKFGVAAGIILSHSYII